jgi:hypothetical protein
LLCLCLLIDKHQTFYLSLSFVSLRQSFVHAVGTG